MQATAENKQAVEQVEQAPATVKVNRIIINTESINRLIVSKDEQAMHSLYFGAKAGQAAHADKFRAVAHIFITLITDGGNKRALLEPESPQAQASVFYRALHASTSKAAAIKGLRAAIDIAKDNVSAAANSEKKAIELMQKIEDAFMAHAPKAREARPATDKVAAALAVLQKAQKDHILNAQHASSLYDILKQMPGYTTEEKEETSVQVLD